MNLSNKKHSNKKQLNDSENPNVKMMVIPHYDIAVSGIASAGGARAPIRVKIDAIPLCEAKKLSSKDLLETDKLIFSAKYFINDIATHVLLSIHNINQHAYLRCVLAYDEAVLGVLTAGVIEKKEDVDKLRGINYKAVFFIENGLFNLYMRES